MGRRWRDIVGRAGWGDSLREQSGELIGRCHERRKSVRGTRCERLCRWRRFDDTAVQRLSRSPEPVRRTTAIVRRGGGCECHRRGRKQHYQQSQCESAEMRPQPHGSSLSGPDRRCCDSGHSSRVHRQKGLLSPGGVWPSASFSAVGDKKSGGTTDLPVDSGDAEGGTSNEKSESSGGRFGGVSWPVMYLLKQTEAGRRNSKN